MVIKMYNIFNNIKFTHNYVLGTYKNKYLVLSLIYIITAIIKDLMMIFLPSIVILELKNSGDLPNIILKLLSYGLVLFLFSFVSKKCEIKTYNKVTSLRFLKSKDYYSKLMNMEYETLTDSRKQTLIFSGLDSYMDDYHLGFSYIITDTRAIIYLSLSFLVQLLISSNVDIRISICIILSSIISVLLAKLLDKWRNEEENYFFKEKSKFKKIFMETSKPESQKDIRIYGFEDFFCNNLNDKIHNMKKWLYRELKIKTLVSFLRYFMIFIKLFASYFIIIKLYNYKLTVELFVYISAILTFSDNSMTSIVENIDFVYKNSRLVTQSRKVLGLKDEIVDVKGNEILLNNWEIDLVDVSYKYPNKDDYALKDINLKIKNREKLAIVGLNGSGKTTLIMIICRLIKPSSGKVLLNGIDVEEIPLKEYRGYISVIFQDLNVFAFSVEENVALSQYVDDEKIDKSLKKANLNFLCEDKKYELMTRVFKDDGIVLSGGNNQRIMLARCIYKNSNIAILDEPTAYLDSITESEFYNEYREIMKDKTVIFISHRLSSTKFCDRIVLMDNGKINGIGSHIELLNRNELYKRMFEIQSKPYFEERGMYEEFI